jgi:alcohol dehydrogenase, propanol-preferring
MPTSAMNFWKEKFKMTVRTPLVSVANLTRQDGLDFLRLVREIGIVTKTTRYPLSQANQALADLRAGRYEGAAVLVP